MKKKLLILAAVAVSGLAAVVASNVNVAEADNNECLTAVEIKKGKKYCCKHSDQKQWCEFKIDGHTSTMTDAYEAPLE